MKKYLAFYVMFVVLLGCATSNKIGNTRQIQDFKNLMDAKSFAFTADWANPLATQSLNAISNAGLLPPGSNVGAIQLNGTSNFLNVEGDTVSANLPYFGERRFGGGYGTNTGIEFEGRPTSFLQEYNPDKNRFDITFMLTEDMESFNVTLNIYPNKTASVTVNSNQRNVIRYSGHISKLEGRP